ncbi:MAG TPA: hypothetical protein VD968_06395 [Pyrinomonadaceae bacterium]|nr:hypothetical protein [Pyrinomonadaceae bacterium]
MRPCSRLTLCALLLCLLVAPAAFAQKRFCPKPPPSPYKHDGQIATSFDGKSRAMRTTLQHPRAFGQGADLVYLAATFVHQDPRRPSRPTLDLILTTASPALKLRGAGLAFVCDGQPCARGVGASYRSQTGDDGLTYDSVRLTLSYDEASAVTRARKVSARIGGTDVELTNNHLEALRELVSQLAPSPGRWGSEERLSAR